MKCITTKNKIQLLTNGAHFIEENIKLINNAKEFIFFHTYIFNDDEVTFPIIEALLNAKDRKVSIFIIFDAYGSAKFSKETQNKLLTKGIHFKLFKPIVLLKNIGRRLHQKLLLIDNHSAIVGGINYAKEFNSPMDSGPWLDYASLIEGEEVNNIFKKVLHLYITNFRPQKDQLLSFQEISHKVNNETNVCTNENDWMRYKQEIYKSYLTAINSAKSEITILATYFIPGKKLLKELKKAQDRGVVVKLIFGSLSDHSLVSTAADYFYQWYIDHGIEIYEWDTSIIHGKLALIDNEWVTIGSYNHNYISRYGNLELNIEVINSDLAISVKEEFSRIIEASKRITETNLSKTIGNKIIIYLIYLLTNLITFLSIALIFKRQKENNELKNVY
jgi:cardiolipin synthase